MAKSILDKYTELLRQEGIKPLTKRSRDWYIDLLFSGELKGRAKQVFRDKETKKVATPKIGRMYTFKYDPKYKKTLPYYDIFPLIILADTPRQGKGFYGLNMHYLRPNERALFFSQLEKNFSTTKGRLTENTRLRMNYQTLKAASRLKRYKPTFKQYLPEKVKSNIVEIPPEFWEVALFLPTQKFKKASTSEVWMDSKKMSR
jgi:hypothetical protein